MGQEWDMRHEVGARGHTWGECGGNMGRAQRALGHTGLMENLWERTTHTGIAGRIGRWDTKEWRHPACNDRAK